MVYIQCIYTMYNPLLVARKGALMKLTISDAIISKLKTKHNVSENDIEECFSNREGKFLVDDREDHRTNPETNWFIAETHYGRKLKIIFMVYPDSEVRIKSAYEPNPTEIRIYTKYANI